MTISSMYRNEEVYTENVDEFIFLRYTIASRGQLLGKRKADILEDY